MKLTAYIHPRRTAITPTGVGKHMIHMVLELARQSGVDLKLFTSRRDITDGHIDLRSPLAHLPVLGHPLSRSFMERLWLMTGYPKADKWSGNADWVYCPAEAYVPLRRARLAATIHCVNWFEPELPWYNAPATRAVRRRMHLRWKTILDRADVVLTVSEFLKGRIQALFGADPNRLVVVGNGVEEEFFVAGQTPGPSTFDGDRYILVVGGLTQRKGADYVFPLALELEKRDPKIQIRIAGGSEPRYEAQSKSHRNVIHCGYQGTDTLPKLMRESVAVVFLSRYETFGIPAAEAMAAGAPAVVSAFAALPEIVGDGGMVVDVARPDLIAEEIRRLGDDRAFRQGFIERGKRRAREFHWSAAAGRLMAALQGERR
ncbi:MAG TPA: glycosyltransferase [Tepidisphaeraceae bacterium]|jgi:glycosyltransferase involved in cell wall biosynthesis|nr:glycosyltransferase [Tepidisphaeraceae bacterium]